MIFVGIGGFIGAVSRYIAASVISRFTQQGFPWGTVGVNVIGCLLLGMFTGVILDKSFSWPLKEFIIIGLLGGFTTFSTFGLETYHLLKSGHIHSALGYVTLSLITGIVAIGAGIFFSRSFIS